MPIGCRFFNDNKAFYKRKNYLCSVRISMVFWQFSFDSMNHVTKRQLKKEIRSRLFIMVACSRLSCGGRNHPNEVVWTFMRFKICLYFWGVFWPWRGSVASYTTDERSKIMQTECRTTSSLDCYAEVQLILCKKRPKRKVKIESRRA